MKRNKYQNLQRIACESIDDLARAEKEITSCHQLLDKHGVTRKDHPIYGGECLCISECSLYARIEEALKNYSKN